MSPPPGMRGGHAPISPTKSRGPGAPSTPWTPPKVPQAAPAANPPSGTTAAAQHPSFIMGYNQAAKQNILSPRYGKLLSHIQAWCLNPVSPTPGVMCANHTTIEHDTTIRYTTNHSRLKPLVITSRCRTQPSTRAVVAIVHIDA